MTYRTTPHIIASWLASRRWFPNNVGDWINYSMASEPMTWEQAVALEVVTADIACGIQEKAAK